MKGLILTGGKSRRMGRDKAGMEVDGVSLRERTIRLVRPWVEEVFLSVGFGEESGVRDGVRCLPDLAESRGPLGGLEAAFAEDGESSWLVVACDLPFLGAGELAKLVEGDDGEFEACCFLSALDGEPEPLCAIYGPGAAGKLREFLDSGQGCARRFLGSLERRELSLENERALMNVNRPEQWAEFEILRQEGEQEKEVAVEYFAKLSEEAGKKSEIYRTKAATMSGLWEELRMRYRFGVDLPHVRVAVDDEFVGWQKRVETGQRIAWMPPFAGG